MCPSNTLKHTHTMMGLGEYQKAAVVLHDRVMWGVSLMVVYYTIFFAFMMVSSSSIVHTYFAAPTMFGVLQSDRFHSLYSFMLSSYAMLIPLIAFLYAIVASWKKRWLKLFTIGYCVLLLVLFVCLVGANIVYVSTANDPADPKNPANSDRACCVAEFYSTYSGCRNFDAAMPECNPPILLKELGINAMFVFQFVTSMITVAFLIMFLVFLFQLLNIVDKLIPYSAGVATTTTTTKTNGTSSSSVKANVLPLNNVGGAGNNSNGRPTAAPMPSQPVLNGALASSSTQQQISHRGAQHRQFVGPAPGSMSTTTFIPPPPPSPVVTVVPAPPLMQFPAAPVQVTPNSMVSYHDPHAPPPLVVVKALPEASSSSTNAGNVESMHVVHGYASPTPPTISVKALPPASLMSSFEKNK